MTKDKISIDQARDYLSRLDLDYIVQTMCHTSYSLPRWSLADAKECEKRYKNFLLLHKIHRRMTLVPTKFIDEFWHNHILHTQKYFRDCEHIFGHYFHHEPVSLSDNMQLLTDHFIKTKTLYFAEFGEEML